MSVNSNTEFIGRNKVNLHIRVRYGECDAQQVVFNAGYADYADIAATEYMRALIGDFNNMLAAGFDNQVVNLNIDWFNSAKFDDVLVLSVSTTHVGNTSFKLETLIHKIEASGEQTPITRSQTTYVVVDTQQFAKQQIPSLLLENFSRQFELSINQAG